MIGSGWMSYRGSPRSLPHPWGWCEFWARTPAEPGAAVRPGSLQRWRGKIKSASVLRDIIICIQNAITSDVLHFGSDPSELENPASFADTQAAKQSLSSKVIVSICWEEEQKQHDYESSDQLEEDVGVTASKRWDAPLLAGLWLTPVFRSTENQFGT